MLHECDSKTIAFTLPDIYTTATESSKPCLSSLAGKYTGSLFQLSVDKVLKIGRDSLSDVVLEGLEISRYHAEIYFQQKSIPIIKDISSNGILINRKPYNKTEQILCNNDSIQIGKDNLFKFVYLDDVEIKSQIQLYSATLTDPLTQIGNKRYFNDSFDKEFSYHMRYQLFMGLLIIDLDHFKKINDKHGHQVGDKIIKLFAQRLKGTLRNESTLARIGGEEFAVIIRNASKRQIISIAERILHSINSSPFAIGGEKLPVTASIGISVFSTESKNSKKRLFEDADKRLYQAKENGRNRICYE
jgi:diguanylate cyclase (GGDEF)-like protein